MAALVPAFILLTPDMVKHPAHFFSAQGLRAKTKAVPPWGGTASIQAEPGRIIAG
jgi:hypothetical protein